MLKVFTSPSRYVQGREATRHLGQELLGLGIRGTAVILASSTARQQLEPTWQAVLDAASLPYRIIDFNGECSRIEIDRLREASQSAAATVIIGAGGGKALDTARAVASELQLPVVNCPTTASSDAPCSALSVIYTEQGIFEECRFYPRNPDLILVDSSVIVRAPVRFLIAGMGDALATWFEADAVYRAHKANVVRGECTLAAHALANLCYRTLLQDGPAAVAAAQTGAITPAFERIVEANTLLSGIGFESGGLAIAHSVHNGLTVLPETHACLHGEKVAFGTLVQLVAEGAHSSQVEEVMAFCRSVGLPITLAELGLNAVSEAMAWAIAERAVAVGETAHNEPFEVTPAILRDALMSADSWGRAFQLKRG